MAWTVPSVAQALIYAKDVWVEGKRDSFWSKYINGADGIIEYMPDIEKDPGDDIKIWMVENLEGGGLNNYLVDGHGDGLASTDGSGIQASPSITTFGAETGRLIGYDKANDETVNRREDVVYRSDNMRLGQFRHFIQSPGRHFHDASGFDFNAHCKKLLTNWVSNYLNYILASHVCGNSKFTFPAAAKEPASGTGVRTRWIYGGVATSEATIDSDCAFNCECISRAKYYASVAVPKIEPAMDKNGQPYFLMVISPEQRHTLRADPEWKNANLYAGPRTDANDIRTGALGEYDGVVILCSETIYKATVSGTKVARAVLLGKKAVCLAKTKQEFWVTNNSGDTADFEDKPAQSYTSNIACTKPQFVYSGTSKADYAVITVSTYAEAPVAVAS